MRTLLHNAILNNKAVDITIDNGLIDSVSTPLPLTNEEGDAFPYYHTPQDNYKNVRFDSYKPLFHLITDFVETL